MICHRQALIAQAPDQRQALIRLAAEGWSHVILDGTSIDGYAL